LNKQLHPQTRLAVSSLFSHAENPRDALSDIAAFGHFEYVMWHHGMHATELYTKEEAEQIASWLKHFGLKVRDVHGTHGKGACWSPDENIRMTGVALLKNRVDLATQLDAKVVTMHIPREPKEPEKREAYRTVLYKTLDEMEPYAQERNILIALENLHYPEWDDFTSIRAILTQYRSEYLGVCYDSGHGNLCSNGLEQLETLKDRLIAIHLNDNLGNRGKTAPEEDRHMLLYTGTVNWLDIAKAIATSSYNGPMSMEIGRRNHPRMSIPEFLEAAYKTGIRFAGEVEVFRRESPQT
jgi:sugar phosphate isomerase/epimerase